MVPFTGTRDKGEDDGDKPICSLQCQNHGICRRGRQRPMGDTLDSLLNVDEQQQQKPQQQEHCLCPQGYTGEFCEIKYKECVIYEDTMLKEQQHICTSNGQECVYDEDDFGERYYHCECDVQQSNMTSDYAVKMCKHVLTVFCGSDKKGRGVGDHPMYCMNGGKCMTEERTVRHNENSKYVCACPPEWDGPHCEFLGDFYQDNSSSSSSAATTTTEMQAEPTDPVVLLSPTPKPTMYPVVMSNANRGDITIDHHTTNHATIVISTTFQVMFIGILCIGLIFMVNVIFFVCKRERQQVEQRPPRNYLEKTEYMA